MSETRCTRRIQFCAGHRVYGHENKCAHVHGHNYVAFITAESTRAQPTDSVGRVIDFSVLKEVVGGWIDHHWDHAMLFWQGDETISSLYTAQGPLADMRHFICPFNPTAENMAQHLLEKTNELLADEPITIQSIRIWETENCYAEVSQ